MRSGFFKGLLTVRPIKEIVVSSRDPQRRKKFCEEGEQLLGIAVRGVDRSRTGRARHGRGAHGDEFIDADLSGGVGRAGDARKQHGQTDGVEPGFAFESAAHRRRQPGAGAKLWRSLGGFAAGRVDGGRENFPGAASRSLGELVIGQAPGRTSRDEINIFRESQGGYGDVAFAAWLVRRGETARVGNLYRTITVQTVQWRSSLKIMSFIENTKRTDGRRCGATGVN